MPFGLHLMSVIVGIILAWFIIPWVQGKFYASRKSTQTNGS